jgi:hypothetical protein
VTTFISIDPGLDVVAAAGWDWKAPGQSHVAALRWVTTFHTSPDDGMSDRLHQIGKWVRELADSWSQVKGIVIELPRRGGMYDRSAHKAAAVMSKVLLSSMASGAMLSALWGATTTHLLEAPTTQKKLKQDRALAVLQAAGMAKPISKRGRKWSEDELDAVAIGMQVMTLREFFPLSREYSRVLESDATPPRATSAAAVMESLADPTPSGSTLY